MMLDVIHGNPARSLYLRLGFRQMSQDADQIQMIWRRRVGRAAVEDAAKCGRETQSRRRGRGSCARAALGSPGRLERPRETGPAEAPPRAAKGRATQTCAAEAGAAEARASEVRDARRGGEQRPAEPARNAATSRICSRGPASVSSRSEKSPFSYSQ